MKNIITTIILVVATLTATAQIELAKQPRSIHANISTGSKAISIAPPTSKTTTIHQKGRAYFGKLLPCDINFMEQSTVHNTDGGTIYTLTLTSQGAHSIGIRTDGLTIAEGSELYVYNNDKDDILGAITSKDSDMSLLTRQIQGDTLNVELFVPQGVKQNDFKITAICYDYANMFGKQSKGFGSSSACNSEIDINCDEGQAFQDIKHAVVLLTVDNDGETFICTGTIVNNINCDQTPYVLTAAHCVCEQQAADHTVIYFNYENTLCGRKSANSNYSSMTGATIVATAPQETYNYRSGRTSSTTYPTMDFTLLKLKKQIPDDYMPYYAGLTTSETDALSSVATIHHPQGEVKKISIAHQKPYQDSYPEEDNSVHYRSFVHWHVAQWSAGTTEGGSSGAALLNGKKQVIGILSGGYANCNNPVDDFFQMISKAWHPSSNPDNQLQLPLAQDTHVKEILPFNPLNIGEKYLPAIVSASTNSDNSIAEISWKTLQISTSKFTEDFENLRTEDDIENVFIANVDMDNDRSEWHIVTDTDAHSGNSCIASNTTTQDNNLNNNSSTNDYLTLPKLAIKAGDTLRFWAKSDGGESTLKISQNTRSSRYIEIKSITIGSDWEKHEIPLDDFAGKSIYINISHITEKDGSTAVYIDDISIDSGTSENTNTITGYEVYCNNELLQTIADTATRSFTHNIERGNTYTYYVLNKYDNATSNIGNSVVIDLDDTPTATSEQLRPQTPLLAYPNPTTGAISITAPYNISKSEIIVADITGRKVMSQEINNIAKDETIELSLAALRPGIYIIRLGSQSVKIQKR